MRRARLHWQGVHCSDLSRYYCDWPGLPSLGSRDLWIGKRNVCRAHEGATVKDGEPEIPGLLGASDYAPPLAVLAIAQDATYRGAIIPDTRCDLAATPLSLSSSACWQPS